MNFMIGDKVRLKTDITAGKGIVVLAKGDIGRVSDLYKGLAMVQTKPPYRCGDGNWCVQHNEIERIRE